MYKLLFVTLLLLVSACGDDTDNGSLTVDDDTTLVNDSLANDSTDTISAIDSHTFKDIGVEIDEYVTVSWLSHTDENTELYYVCYSSGKIESNFENADLIAVTKNEKQIPLEKFTTGTYSFMVVASLYDGYSTILDSSNIVTIDISGGSGVEYTPISLNMDYDVTLNEEVLLKAYSVEIPTGGEYVLEFSTSTSSFNPTVVIYDAEMNVLAEETGVDDVVFSATGTVYIEMSINGSYSAGTSLFEINAK